MAAPPTITKEDLEGRQESLNLFKKHFPNTKVTVAVAAPGRVNLIGEHVDYEGGPVMPLALVHSTYLVGANIESPKCKVVSEKMDGGIVEFTVRAGQTKADAITGPGRWANYIMGMAALYMDEGFTIAPFAAAVSSKVPVGAGLSSSAALEVAAGKLLEDLNGLTVTPERRAAIAQKCEQTFAGVQCGIMDQMVSSCGQTDHALFIECTVPPDVKAVVLGATDAVIVVANSKVPHSLDSGTYNERVAECKAACEVLGVKQLRDAKTEDLMKAKDKLSAVTFARARHVISEMERTAEARTAFEAGDLERFGKLMNDSHDSLDTDYEVTSKGLNELVRIARSVKGVFGSRMTGGGFGGCTVTLVRKDCAQKLINTIEEQYPIAMKGEDLKQGEDQWQCFITSAGAGARSLPVE